MSLLDPPEYNPNAAGAASPTLTPMPGTSDINQASADTYNADQITVDPKSTVSGQMEGLLSQSNPYIGRARTRAAQTANSRGLLNSSMAAGAGEAAAIDAAMPIATQDAQTYGQSQLANQQATNAARAQNSQLLTDVNKANTDALNVIPNAQVQLSSSQQLAQQQAGLQEQLSQGDFNRQLGTMEADVAAKEQFATFDANIRTQLAAIQQDYAVELETLSQNYEIQKNLDTSMGSMYDGALRSISNVLADPNMTTAQSTNAVKVIIDNLGSGLNFLAGISGNTAGVGYEGTANTIDGAPDTTTGTTGTSTSTQSGTGNSVFFPNSNPPGGYDVYSN